MIPYILHVSILIAAGLLFYKLALKRLTFYVMNRWVLLSCLAAAFLLPFMPMPKALSWGGILGSQKATPDVVTVVVKQEVGEKSVAMTGPQPGTVASENIRRERIVRTEEFARTEKIAVRPIPIAARAPTAPAQVADPHEPSDPGASALASGSAARALFYFYLSGVLLLGINLLRQVVLLLFQRYRGQVIRDGRYRIVTTAGMQGPCSFGNIIFIHPGEYDPVTYQQILLHEKIHAGGWHTVDILVAELGIVFQWFNPFIWLYRREMENNLEFLTDRNVLRYPGVERADYQLSLVKVAAPDVSFNITSNYNQSLLKRRIIMMNAQNSARHTAWKYFFLLPLFVLLAGVLNRPAVQAQTVRQKPSSPAKPMRPAGEGTKAVSGSREKPAAPEAKPSIQAVADVEV
ncbi:MAG TPA: M56 family metallopeptidase, partial [Puia sp.]